MKRSLYTILSFAFLWLIACPLTVTAQVAHASAVSTVTISDGYMTSIRNLSVLPGYSQCIYTSGLQDKDGIIWFGSWDGLKRFDGYEFVTFKSKPGDKSPLKSNRFNEIWEADVNHIVCHYGNECYLFNKRTHTFKLWKQGDRENYRIIPKPLPPQISMMPEIDKEDCKTLLQDRQGGYWVFMHHGLYRIERMALPFNISKESNEPVEFVRALYQDSKHCIWRSDKLGYVKLMDQQLRTVGWLSSSGSISKSRTAFGHAVYCFYEDREGRMWLGTKPDGLFMLTPTSANSYKVSRFAHNDKDPSSISFNNIYAITADKIGRLWIATIGGGLNVMNMRSPGRFYNYRNTPSLRATSLRVRALKIYNNVLLIGSDIGLYTCDLRKPLSALHFYHSMRRSDDDKSLNSGNVFQILQTGNNSLWLATYSGGVSRITSPSLLHDRIHFGNYTVSNGLSSDISIAMVEDKRGKLWITSENGLDMLAPDSKKISRFSRLFRNLDLEFTDIHPLCTDDGRLLFGTTRGLLSFYPDDMKESSYVPNLIVYAGERIDLKSDNKRLSIKVAAPDYANDADIVYAYRMEGVDDGWNYTRENTITYPNVPNGTHLLHIRSTNADGVWVGNERTVTIHHTPTFSESIWMPLLIALLLAAAFLGGRRLVRYVRDLKNKEQQANEKTEKISANFRQILAEHSSEEIINDETSREASFSTKATRFVVDNISNSALTLDDFANAMGMSRSVLYQKMKEKFDTTPMNFVQQIRLEQARKLMTETSMPISQISYQCGFSNPKYFSRCFRNLTGMTPKEFRKQG